MALQVWLPLNGDARNLGLSMGNLNVGTLTFSSNDGPLGKALTNGTITIPREMSANIFNNDHMSFAFWIKPLSAGASNNGTPVMGTSNMSAPNNRMYSIFNYNNPSGYHLSWQNETSNSAWYQCQETNVFTTDTWNHFAVVFDVSKIYVYLNGSLFKTHDCGAQTRSQFNFNFPIVAQSANRHICDVRIYNNSLSAKEVKEISKCLLVHFPCTAPWEPGNDNLLKNTDNIAYWGSNAARIPLLEDGKQCWKCEKNSSSSFSFGQILTANTTYTYSAWIKDVTNTRSFGFSSLGHFQVYNSASSASDKAHEDVVSARIYKPATIQQNQWTHISITFTTNSLNNSSFNAYPSYNTSDTVYIYGMKLEEGTEATPWRPHKEDIAYQDLWPKAGNTVGDVSGYRWIGTYTNQLDWDSVGPRYLSVLHSPINGYIQVPFNMYFPKYTLSYWVKLTNTLEMPVGSLPTPTSQWYWYADNSWKYNGGEFYYHGSGNTWNSKLNKWVHQVAVYDGANVTIYQDSENLGSKAVTGSLYWQNLSIGRGYSLSTSGTGSGELWISDFRLYSTALSATDIKELYETSMIIDDSGNVFPRALTS